MHFFKKFFYKKKINRDLDILFDQWKYEDNKKLYVFDGNELVEEMTFKQYVDRQVEDAVCDCRRNRKYWEIMLSSAQIYPLRPCCEKESNRF